MDGAVLLDNPTIGILFGAAHRLLHHTDTLHDDLLSLRMNFEHLALLALASLALASLALALLAFNSLAFAPLYSPLPRSPARPCKLKWQNAS